MNSKTKKKQQARESLQQLHLSKNPQKKKQLAEELKRQADIGFDIDKLFREKDHKDDKRCWADKFYQEMNFDAAKETLFDEQDIKDAG